MFTDILSDIVASKKTEIQALYTQYDLETLRRETTPTAKSFIKSIACARAKGRHFFITEFKRKSPSEGWINRDADLPAQIGAYVEAGAGAVSVLTDGPFFGGSFDDLRQAAGILENTRVLLLQKDFVIDPIQIYLARQNGADLILLIAAILDPAQIQLLKETAESLNMGILAEVHDEAELAKIHPFDFPVIGVNSRDLKTFRLALNRINYLRRQLVEAGGGPYFIAESGIRDEADFQLVKEADGFLIGAGLMRGGTALLTNGLSARPLLKACGIRTPELLKQCGNRAAQTTADADYYGINFSPVSKRRIDPQLMDDFLASGDTLHHRAVALFYKNEEAEIRAILEKYAFKTVQLYAGDVTPDFIRTLKQRILLAVSLREPGDLETVEAFAPDVDLFVLDGAVPGSGQESGVEIPADFPYPFLLAGGVHAGNLDRIRAFEYCAGVDVASGIETQHRVDPDKIRALAEGLRVGVSAA
jgi:indole-3-glycerol phosphate synthase/phosphoribosylanthranilate isomerase